MDIGMLWFDDTNRPLKDKVARAVGYYADKYGRQPTTCLVHPQTLNGGQGTLAGVEVRGSVSVMPHHFWVGIEENDQQPKVQRRKKAA